jgi:hypothetical protein
MHRLATIAVATAALTGAGCTSAKRTIEAEAIAIDSVAKSVRTDAQTIRDNAQDLLPLIPEQVAYPDDMPNAFEKVKTIIAAAERIDHGAERIGGSGAKIREKLPGVVDTTPWWQTLLGMGFWGLIGMGIALVLAWYGLLPLVLRAIASIVAKVPALASALIPPRVRAEAKLDYEAFDPADPKQTAAMGVKRTSPLYDAAFRVAKKGAAR